MVLKISDLNRTQIYKLSYRDSLKHETQILEFFII